MHPDIKYFIFSLIQLVTHTQKKILTNTLYVCGKKQNKEVPSVQKLNICSARKPRESSVVSLVGHYFIIVYTWPKCIGLTTCHTPPF